MKTNILKTFQIFGVLALILSTANCSSGTTVDAQTDESISADDTDTTGDDTAGDETAGDETPTDEPGSDEVPCEPVTTTFYADADADGFGDAAATQDVSACEGEAVAPAGYVADASDCLDTDALAYPGGTEILADGIDQDCSGMDKYLTQVVATNYDSDGVTLLSIDTATLSAEHERETFVHDHLGDGLLTRRDNTTVYTRDAALGTETSVKTDGKGTCLLQTSRSTDANDNLTLEATDRLCNGFYEDQIAYVNTYDANDDLTQRDLTISEDTDDDGIFDVVTLATRTFAYTYQDAESTIVSTVTVLQDGLDYRYTEFDANSHGTLNNVNDSDPLTGTYTESNVMTYDANGFLLSKAIDDLATVETPDQTDTFERDAFGVKTRLTSTDSTGATIAVTVFSNTYSE